VHRVGEVTRLKRDDLLVSGHELFYPVEVDLTVVPAKQKGCGAGYFFSEGPDGDPIPVHDACYIAMVPDQVERMEIAVSIRTARAAGPI
jgi:hypothetical protein